MKGELEKATARADRAEEDLANAVEEAEALRELTVQDTAVMEVELEEMRDKLKEAERSAARAVLGLDGDAASKKVIEELEGQVAELLAALQEAQDGVAELMILRPKLAAAEKKLKEME